MFKASTVKVLRVAGEKTGNHLVRISEIFDACVAFDRVGR